MNPVNHFLRRSRRSAHAQPVARMLSDSDSLDKRFFEDIIQYTPEQISSLDAASSSAALAVGKTTSTSSVARVAAQPATIATSLSPARLSSFSVDTTAPSTTSILPMSSSSTTMSPSSTSKVRRAILKAHF